MRAPHIPDPSDSNPTTGNAGDVKLIIEITANYPADQGRFEDGGYDELHDEFRNKPDAYVRRRMAEFDWEANPDDLWDAASNVKLISVDGVRYNGSHEN